MNKADEIRDKMRQLRYLMDEKKFIDDLVRKLDEQKNRLHLEALSIRSLINESANQEPALEEEEWTEDVPVAQEPSNAFLFGGTPSRPIEAPVVPDLVPSLELSTDQSRGQPKAVVEAIDLDVRKVLLKLASGGHHEEEEEEEEDED